MEYAVEKSKPNAPSAQKELVKLILEVTDADYIFLSPCISPTGIVTILIDLEKETIPTTLITNLSEIFDELPGMNFRVYRIQTAREELDQGNLFFLRNCFCGRLLYHRPDLSFPDLFQNVDPKEPMQKARTWFLLEMDKIYAFKKGAYFFKKQKNRNQAAYLIHQTLELQFRCLEIFEMGKSKACHKIANHLEYTTPFVPDVNWLFNKNDGEDEQLLRLLDKAYCDTRYTNIYSIKKEEVKLLLKKAEMMEFRVREIFKSRIEDCNQYLQGK